MQMRIEVPGLAAEKMAGARGGSGLDHLTTVSSYQDSLMFTSAPADLAHGPDGKGPELEAVHLESMSNLSEGHMPRAHAHDRHAGGDSTGDLALAHYDECAPPLGASCLLIQVSSQMVSCQIRVLLPSELGQMHLCHCLAV